MKRYLLALLCASLVMPWAAAQQSNSFESSSTVKNVRNGNVRNYGGLSFMIPAVGSGNFNWGLDFTGLGVEYYFSDAMFVDVSGHLMYGMSRYKYSKENIYVTHCFSLHAPVLLGIAVDKLSVRAGGFLQLSAGWMKEKYRDEVERSTFGEMDADRFGYGIRLGVSWDAFDVGFLMTWTPNSSGSAKGLTFGLRF